ncbi:hypothetical protein [Solirubrobacter soli]|uniref:hypothetical protein n=1 Tax=Solirubrobacter soli TaxID=363832 RepID=UPI00047FA894|nr:hypothetical protein [Solirubrobacter soli]
MRPLFAVCLLLLGLCAPAAADARPCAMPAGARLLGHSRNAVVWKVGDDDHWNAVVCVSGKRSSIEWGDWQGGDFRLSRLRFAGHWLAYVNSYSVGHYGDGGVRLSVVDLRKRVRTSDLYLMSQAMGDSRPRMTVTSLVLTREGAIGWRFSGNVDPARNLVEFHDGVGVLDRARARIVATAAPGEITAFRLRESTVTWTSGGVAGSAVMSGAARCPLQNDFDCWPAKLSS